MELNNYLKSCSKGLLKKLCDLSKDKRLVDYFLEYDKNLIVSADTDYSWSLISTALLLSENLWKNESVYKNISKETVATINYVLNDCANPIRGDQEIVGNCLLDENNVTVNPFDLQEIEESFKEAEEQRKHYNYVRKLDINYRNEADIVHQEFVDMLFKEGKYGCNAAIMGENGIDIRKLIIRVRHALAHSNYEIINENFIRLYHYNANEKQYDFNVALNKNTVITILDELNEMFYKQCKNFEDEWYIKRRPYIGRKRVRVDEKKLLKYLLSFDILDENNCKEVINNAPKNPEYAECYIEDKLIILYECILEKISPVCSYGIIVNEFLYGNNEGLMDDTYYDKVGYYKYFNSDFFSVKMDSDSDFTNVHKTELLLFAFLNCSLLNVVNINNNEINKIIDFSKMQIREEDYVNASKGSSKLTFDLQNQANKISKEIGRLNKLIKRKLESYHNNNGKSTEYFTNTLPNEIHLHINEKSRLIKELNDITIKSQVKDLISISNYILTHLRNSLAHGYIKIIGEVDLENISETELEFSDYNPDDKSELTFKGCIKLGDLIEILTDKRYVDNVVDNKDCVRNK